MSDLSNGGSSSWISACIAAHEVLVERPAIAVAAVRRCLRRTARTSSARSNRSGIRRCSPNPAACRRRNRRADTSRRPRHALSMFARKSRGLGPATLGERHVARSRGDVAKLHQHVVQEKRQPDALALAMDADVVHAVVPVAGAHQRQAVRAETQPVHDGAAAVLVAASPIRRARPAGRSTTPRSVAKFAAIEKWYATRRSTLVVAGGLDVAARGTGQPQIVVGAARAHAAARSADATSAARRPRRNWRDAQSSSCARSMFGSQCTSAIDVLQLVAKAPGAAGLVVAAAAPDARRRSPGTAASRWRCRFERRIGRAHLHCAERALPVCTHGVQCVARRAGPCDNAARDRRGLLRSRRPAPRRKMISRDLPSARSNGTWIAAHGSSAAPILPDRRVRRSAAGFFSRTVATDEFGAIAGDGAASGRRHRTTRRDREIRD